jgi:hypothetical protein
MVEKNRHLGVIFDNNLRWNIHINNLLGKLRFITYKMVKLKNIATKPTMKIVYFALYQSNFQYGILAGIGWTSRQDNVLNALVVNKNNIVRMCLNKLTLHGSTNNYKKFGVLPIRFLYKKLLLCTLLRNFI